MISVKKTALVILALALTGAGLMPAPASADTYTSDNPYPISSFADLQEFKTYVEANLTETVNAKLTADIVCPDGGWINLIGQTSEIAYKGTFDGNGHKITLVNKSLLTSPRTGLFYDIANGSVVQDLKVEVIVKNASTLNSTDTTQIISPVAMYNHGTIQDVTVNCAIVTQGPAFGVVSANHGTVERVTVNGWIQTVRTTTAVAGIAQYSYSGSVIRHCVNNATLIGFNHVGGLVSFLNGRLEYSANHGDVTNNSTNRDYTGGLAAEINFTTYGDPKADIYNCYNAGAVSGGLSNRYGIGGLVGGYSREEYAFQEDYGIVNSFNFGHVTANTGASAAIIGTGVTAQSNGNPVPVKAEDVAGCSNVYYLEGCADAIFGPGSTAVAGDKFIGKDAEYFRDELFDVLNGGPGGKITDENVWKLAGISRAWLPSETSPWRRTTSPILRS
ncbi:MAG: hypothetical protein LBQ36_02370 [Synergistaceae bacterium]|nr:hypothetical protein [Synergistaceae bacterium]